ncbi:chemotaxis protein MotB [Desulfacinum hydrothermale DSM 13146]|uniref:Chemotaxis protein MotB n=1 Tax=Desulfacinum hydrothermale DSM 13146 TaxID=1121390 RepID=A0A1W1X6P0_9BACT|nr:flagellar motor protein MotB [Desulfacinum hydrothermale]SMC19388.1 chemotaxis protein MotB [Desulfacinum hydrothermale DSM 13146]
MPDSSSSKKKKGNGGEEGPAADGWLTTYCDLCTLLLTFFVLLLSMSVLDNTRKKEVLNSLVGAFGFLPGGRAAIGIPKGSDISEFSSPLMEDKDFNFELLHEVTMKNELDPKVDIIKRDKEITIVLNQRLLFEPGSFTLTQAASHYLAQIAPYLRGQNREVEIRGHTDRYEDIRDPRWIDRSYEISTRRAMAVYRKLISLGVPMGKMSVHGFSFSRPLVDGAQFPHLRYKNQRVEIAMTYSRSLPASLVRAKPKPTPYFNYKNFFFRLFPMDNQGASGKDGPDRSAMKHTVGVKQHG